MAILNSIRQRGVFLILIIALALFAFILSDILTSRGGAKGQTNIATINGVDIPREDFMREVEMTQRNTNANTSVAMNRVWEQELRRVLMEEQFEKAGITVEKAQLDRGLKAALGNNPTFLNEAGEVDDARIQEYIATIKASSPQMYQEWIQFENALSIGILEDTYINMIKGGLHGSQLEGEQEYHFENDKVNFTYAMVPYSSITDEEINVTDKEIQKYISERPKQFEVEASADLEYVLFSENPSDADIEEAKKEISTLLTKRVEFNRETKANDSLPGFQDVEDFEEFVNTHSEVPYSDRWYFENELPSSAASNLIALEKGQVYGPYRDGNTYNISKVIDTKKMPDSADSKHILIRYVGTMRAGDDITRSKEEAAKMADSILAVVKKTPSKFEDLAKELSDDPSKGNGGDLGTSTPGRMVPPFDQFIFNNPEGTIGLVETDFGYHVVQVGKQSAAKPAIKIATVVKPIEPSDKTMNDLFSDASKFEVAVSKGDFNKVAEEQNLEVRPVNKIGPMHATIPGIDNNRGIVTWAFNKDTKVGDTKRFSVSNGYVIARLTRKNKKGLASVEDVSDKVKPILIKEKKAQKIKESLAGKSMEEIAQSQNTSVRTASSVSLGNPMIGASKEPKVVGYAFGTKSGETTKLIEGNDGIYMLKVGSLTPAPKMDNYRNQAQKLGQKNQSSAPSQVINALKKKADIKDNRAEFY
ncbi:MAG TPA: peptidylprolyl isomerase [Flavobacteriaceae bacterium]|nr:peptidylprolyl isomerase [Flavobacteriaceae bacterium]